MHRYTVVLLDDEELILESLQTLIDWQELECSVAGTAKSGAQGRELIRRLRPDIVITDIKMPELSGLEIAEYCARELPDTRVIILSAYSDFAFAQSALRARTANYLLKPISKTELADAIRKVVSELRQIESSRVNKEQARADLENAKTLATASLLFNLARYGTAGSERADRGWIGEQVRSPSVVVAGTFFNLNCPIAPVLALGQTHTHQGLRQAGYAPIFGSADENILFLCPVQTGIDRTTARNRIIAVLRRILDTAPAEVGIGVFCISEVYDSADSLQCCYRDTLEMLHQSFFRTRSGVIEGKKQPGRDLGGMNTQDLVFALRHGNRGEVEQVLDRWKRTLTDLENEIFALEKLREWSREATVCAARLGMDTQGLWQHRYVHENFEARYDCMRRGVLEVCDYARKKAGVISRMCLYVEEHYGDSTLSLESVADELGLNSSYLSRAFKKEMKENFSEYLVRIRIDHARKLLSATSMKTYAIAREVGFSDPHYFSQVFKKKCGMAPAEYRAMEQKK